MLDARGVQYSPKRVGSKSFAEKNNITEAPTSIAFGFGQRFPTTKVFSSMLRAARPEKVIGHTMKFCDDRGRYGCKSHLVHRLPF
jgi:hypothetical protein